MRDSCPACLSTHIVLTAGRVVKKYTTHISLKKHLTSYQKVFHANESAESFVYCLEHYVHGRKG